MKIHKVQISGAEMYSMYVGEGEALLRNTFQRARLAAPSIIFFDEADVVAAKRLVCYIYSIRFFCVCACLLSIHAKMTDLMF